jgi:16S rRNA U1498 N3-methylase RsmE
MFEGAVPNEMLRLASGVEHPSGGDHSDYFERVRRRLNGERIQVVDSAEGLRTTALIEDIYAGSLHDNSMTAEQFTALFSGYEK